MSGLTLKLIRQSVGKMLETLSDDDFVNVLFVSIHRAHAFISVTSKEHRRLYLTLKHSTLCHLKLQRTYLFSCVAFAGVRVDECECGHTVDVAWLLFASLL